MKKVCGKDKRGEMEAGRVYCNYPFFVHLNFI